MNVLENKIRNNFEKMAVYKNLTKNKVFEAFGISAFMRDWLLGKFQNIDGNYDIDEVSDYIKTYIPDKNDWLSIKNRIIIDYENVLILAKIRTDISVRNQSITFSLPDYPLTNKDTIIEPNVWEECRDYLSKGNEVWGVLELGYKLPAGKEAGKIKLVSFQDFCPYEIDKEYYKEVRNNFSFDEWLDVLLGAIDYNPSGYPEDDNCQKLTMLTRLLPFVEKRLNLIELAPKGTGKSYLFGRVSKYGWLSSGGVMSRAKMFYDISKRQTGLIVGNDYVALDEVQTINFSNVDEMRAAMKGYMEAGTFTIGNYEGSSEAGIILLGNIKKENQNELKNMFIELPEVFHESALLDRFHGFIKGWNIPRMHDDLKMKGWALNSEYFCSILHELRDDASYRAIVDEVLNVPPKSDTRHTEAIKRITTAYLKLLFPNVKEPNDIIPFKREFKNYCLKPAKDMRNIIKLQLTMLDDEYKDKNIPDIRLNEQYDK